MDDYTTLAGNPFVANGLRTLGQPWKLPNFSSLLPAYTNYTEAGYGCFANPSVPLGVPIDVTKNGTVAPSIATACRPGFFCPYLNISSPTTYPAVCPPDNNCFITKSFGRLCNYSQGVFEPMACPKGFYCPDYKTVLPCPEGYFCLTGTSEPTPCQFLSICNTGTVIEQHYGLLIFVAIADLFLLGAYLFMRYRERQMNKPPAYEKSPLLVKQTESSPTEEGQPQNLQLEGSHSIQLRVIHSSATISAADKVQHHIASLMNGFPGGVTSGNSDVSMDYNFESLGLKIADGKIVLNGVTGQIRSGRMTAIMGPSGAGKTTFMNVLMGKVARTSGTLKINNTIAEMNSFKNVIGYVPQEDIMIEELTVRENIRYACRVRQLNTWTNQQVESHVDAILNALNLAHVAHKRIGSTLERGISGGQRKRVNIGMELAASPLSLFLDEPTSGLDSTSSMDVCGILSSISRLGLTIVAVIHQPRVEIFESFDDVFMIAPGGMTAYFGPAMGAMEYFEGLGFIFKPNTNVADSLMDILSGRGELAPGVPSTRATSAEIVNLWSQHMAQDEFKPPSFVAASSTRSCSVESLKTIAKKRGASFFRQMVLAHNRSIVQQMRLISAFALELLVGLVAGGIMGFSSGGGENFVGHLIAPYTALSAAETYWFLGLYGMLVGIAIALASAPSGVKTFSEEKPVYIRESEAGHSSAAYFIGKNVAVIYRIMLASAHFVALYYLLAQPPIPLGTQYIMIALNFFGVYGMGMIVSMFTRRENAPLIAVTVCLISEVLNGFGPALQDATSGGYVFLLNIGLNRWMSETQYTLWVEPYKNIFDFPLATSAFGYQFDNTTRNLLVMLALGVAYRVIAYMVFAWILHQKVIKRVWSHCFGRNKKAAEVQVV